MCVCVCVCACVCVCVCVCVMRWAYSYVFVSAPGSFTRRNAINKFFFFSSSSFSSSSSSSSSSWRWPWCHRVPATCTSSKACHWRVSGAEQEYSLSKARVKRDRAWSPTGRLTVMWQALRPPRRFLRSQLLCRLNKSPSDETINRCPPSTHAKTPHMPVKDPVVHVRVRWTVDSKLVFYAQSTITAVISGRITTTTTTPQHALRVSVLTMLKLDTATEEKDAGCFRSH